MLRACRVPWCCISRSRCLRVRGRCQREPLGRCIEPRKREGLGLAKVGGGEPALLFAVGLPVPAATLMARPFAAGCKGPTVTDKGEARSRLQPPIPGGCANSERLGIPIMLIDQRVTLDDGSHSYILSAVK